MRLGGRGQEELFLEGEVLAHHHQISRQEELRASSCGSHHPATGLRGPPHRTTIPRSPGPGPLRPTERPLDPPPRPQIGQTWGPSLFAQRRRWFTEGTIRELIETGRRAYFRKNPGALSASALIGPSCETK